MAENIRKILRDERQLNQIANSSFQQYDADKSGFIDEKELFTVISKVFVALNCEKPTREQVREILKKIDKNKDGVVSYDEYLSLVKMVLQEYLESLEESQDDKKNENIEKKVNKQLQLFEKYLEDSGISIAFQIIYTEILTKKIDPENVFTYTAMRLRQIGKEVAHLLPANLTSKITEKQ